MQHFSCYGWGKRGIKAHAAALHQAVLCPDPSRLQPAFMLNPHQAPPRDSEDKPQSPDSSCGHNKLLQSSQWCEQDLNQVCNLCSNRNVRNNFLLLKQKPSYPLSSWLSLEINLKSDYKSWFKASNRKKRWAECKLVGTQGKNLLNSIASHAETVLGDH